MAVAPSASITHAPTRELRSAAVPTRNDLTLVHNDGIARHGRAPIAGQQRRGSILTIAVFMNATVTTSVMKCSNQPALPLHVFELQLLTRAPILPVGDAKHNS